jgi:hypothetical protein
MITISFADAGTKWASVNPSPDHSFMELGWYNQERGYEHYFWETQRSHGEVDPTFLNATQHRLIPFSPGMGHHMWVDRTDRYETIEGFFLELWSRDEATGNCHKLPRCPHMWLDVSYEVPETNPQECVTKPLNHHTPNEAATINPAMLPPSELNRLPLKNETEYTGNWRGYTHLKNPILADIHGYEGSSLILVNPNDSLLFAPFDFRHPEWYRCFNENGEELQGVEHWLTLRPDADYVIHLRPRRWRWEVFVLVHYAYISLWGIQPNDEYFTHIFFDRPPVYPYRHDVIHSKEEQGSQNWNNDYRSYDIGIDYYWETTNAAADLARQILDQQYAWYSMVYMFLSNENPDLFLDAYPPQTHDYVCGIERIDRSSGSRTVVWVRQARNLDSVYPHFRFGSFLLNWQVVPEEPRWYNPGGGDD